MKFKTVPHFGTPDLPDPYSGAHLGMKFKTVPHVGTPDLPYPCSGAHLGMKFETNPHFENRTRQNLVVVSIWN